MSESPQTPGPLGDAVNAALDSGRELGLQIAVYRGSELVIDFNAGRVAPGGPPVTSDTIFPVFSATKAVAAAAAHIQVSRGLLEYDRPVAAYWPEFAAEGKGRTTVLDALTHRTGIPQMPDGVTPEQMCDWELMVERVAALRPRWEPGTRTGYHAYTFGWIVGELVRRTDPARRSFGRYVEEEICRPLRIDALWLGIPDEVEPRIATLVDLPLAQPPTGLLAEALPTHLATSQAVFGRPDVRRSCHPGAGGIMNARGLARLYAMMAGGGELDGARLLSVEVASAAGRLETGDQVDAVLGKVVRKARGFYAYHPDGPDVSALMPSRNAGNFGHPGSGGSTGWADPGLGIGVAVLKNRLLPSALSESGHLLRIRDAIYEALA